MNEDEVEDDDLKAYLEEMKALETDFSDLEDLDLEELQEIQDAISKVQEGEEVIEDGIVGEEFSDQIIENDLKKEREIKEGMISDFSDMDEIDFDELREMQDAIKSVQQE